MSLTYGKVKRQKTVRQAEIKVLIPALVLIQKSF